MIFIRLAIPVSILVLSISGAAEDRIQIELSPASSPVPSPIEVPALQVVTPEATLGGQGLNLAPRSGLYDWTKVAPSDDPFLLEIEVAEDSFDHAILTAWNWHNREVFQHRITAGGPTVCEVSINGLGSWLLTLDGFRDGVCQRRFIRNIAVTEDLNDARAEWNSDEFFVGICAFPGRYHWQSGGYPNLPVGLTEESARNLEAELMARLGLQVVRPDESLDMGRRDDGSYIFDFTRMDAAVNAYTSRGFEIILQTMNASDWAVIPKYADRGKDRWMYPHQEKPQRAYVEALVKQYAPVSRFVQISNEPDQIGYWAGTNEEFVHQFKFTREQIRETAPGLPISYGGFSLVDVPKCQFFLNELHDLVDLPTYNAHGDLGSYKRSFETMKRLQANAGDHSKRWVNTETGYSAWRLDQERRQGQIKPQKILYTWAHDHAGILLFCSRMTAGPGREGTHHFGLLDYQFCPRFVYGTVAALMSTLAGASFEETLTESESIHLYSFRKGMDLILAGFTLEESGVASVITDAGEIIAVDEMGNRVPLDATDRIPLSLDGYPRYWILRNATFVRQDPDSTGLGQ